MLVPSTVTKIQVSSRHRLLLSREEQEEDIEALERSIRARYARSSNVEYDEEITDVEEQALLPSADRNRKIGREKEVALCVLQKGDPVIVVRGDLKKLKGRVQKVEGNTVHIRPNENNLPKSLAFGDKELCKYFEPGYHVKVVSGASKGATGMVVSVEGHVVNIVCHTTKEVIRVFAETVVECSEVTCGPTQIGEDSSFGVVIRVESEGLLVLKGFPEKGEVAVVRLREIRGKVHKKCSALDRNKNALSVKDVVRVFEGPSKGKQGPVKHIYRRIVFVYDRHHLKHGGFICARVQSCVLVGGLRASNGDRKADPFSSRFGHLTTPRRASQSPIRSHRGGPPKNFGGGRHGGGRGNRDGLIGTDVKIRIGPFKGCKGRVVDLKGTSVRVELEAQMKVVTDIFPMS